MDLTGFSDKELVYLYHRTNCSRHDFREAYTCSSIREYNEDYISGQASHQLYSRIEDELTRRDIAPEEFYKKKKPLIPINPEYSAEIQDNGDVKVGYISISFDDLQKIYHSATKKESEFYRDNG